MTLPNKSRQGFGEAWSTAVGRQRRRGQTLLPVPRPGPRALSRLREGESSPGTSQSPAEVWGACEAMASHRDARLPPSRLPRSPPGRRSLRGQGAGTRWGGCWELPTETARQGHAFRETQTACEIPALHPRGSPSRASYKPAPWPPSTLSTRRVLGRGWKTSPETGKGRCAELGDWKWHREMGPEVLNSGSADVC